MPPPLEAAAPLKRKIAAILAADVAGYSRLVAADEEGTLRALGAARATFDARVEAGGGRIFNTAGDSVMCEFDSAVEAVRAALDIQASLAEAAAAVPPDRRIAFRIGITIGDVVERGGDLLGDGVNVAARLEALAQPGGICVSRSVHEAASGKVEASFRDLGPRTVKNIPTPVHAFAVAPPGGSEAGRKTARASGRARGRSPRSFGPVRPLAIAAGVAVFLAVGLPALRSARHAAEGGSPGTTTIERAAEQPSGAAGRAAAGAPAAVRPPARGERRAEASPAPRGAVEAFDEGRRLEARGDNAAALKAYESALPGAGEALDLRLRHAALLRGLQGPGAARQATAELARLSGTRSAALAAAIQLDPRERRARLEAMAAAGDFPPLGWFLAETLLGNGGGDAPTLTDRRLAFAALDAFLEAAEGDGLGRFLVDRAYGASWAEAARRRKAEIEAFFATAAARPTAAYGRTAAGGWVGRLALPEPATAIAVRIGERGLFKPTGPSRATDAGTARPAPSAEFEIPAGTGRTTIYVEYTDRSGRPAGPFPLPFDPAAATAEAGRDVLERHPDSWVAFRPDLPDVLSVAGLVSQRCAIARATIGFGEDPPRDPLPLPPCEGAGAAPAGGAPAVLRLPGATDVVRVKLTYADGSESSVRTFRRP